MLSDQDNALICQVGPGTPMGEVFRRFWVPFLLTSNLRKPNGDPVHVELLGKNYVAFRDSKGDVGLLDEYCCHRGASLTLGRVENCGIRCIYHGWLFAADGTVLETPNVSDERFRARFKAKAYPVREAGGLLWAYLGSADEPPSFPDFPWIDSSPEMRLGRIIERDFSELCDNHFGILGAEMILLFALRRLGSPYSARPAHLKRSVLLTSGGLTKLVDRLSSKGLVERRRDPGSLNGQLISLTEEGIALTDQASSMLARESVAVEAYASLPRALADKGWKFCHAMIDRLEAQQDRESRRKKRSSAKKS